LLKLLLLLRGICCLLLLVVVVVVMVMMVFLVRIWKVGIIRRVVGRVLVLVLVLLW
jgi:hypothetical protein